MGGGGRKGNRGWSQKLIVNGIYVRPHTQFIFLMEFSGHFDSVKVNVIPFSQI